jgi:methylmalonyl-CoA/ethylmalonyl-CoA epimerase
MKLAHVGVAVEHLDTAIPLFKKLLGAGEVPIESVPDQGVRVGMLHLAGASIELTEATSPDSPIGKFLRKRGEGVHHLSFEVEDIEAELRRLKSEGFELIDESPRPGAGGCLIAFLHPRSTGGVLVEISQKAYERG